MKQVRGARLTPLLVGSGSPGGFLSLSGFFSRLMVVLDPPEFIISLKNTMKPFLKVQMKTI